MEKKIEELKKARKAYELALEYDYCPSEGKSGFDPDTEEYSGLRPDEIAGAIMRMIENI
jgi:hypothetical protein